MLIEHQRTVQSFMIEGRGESVLAEALKLAIGEQGKIVGWSVTLPVKLQFSQGQEIPPALSLHSLQESGLAFFPAPLTWKDCVPIVSAWLGAAEYPEEPDTDGSTKRGWRLTAHDALPSSGGLPLTCRIEPCWMIYGK